MQQIRDKAWGVAIAGGDLSGVSDTGLLDVTRRAIRDNNLPVLLAAAAAMAAHVRQRLGVTDTEKGQPLDAPEPAPATSLALAAVSHDAAMREVETLLAQGLSGEAIARQWNSEGRRTKKGAEYHGANILRDFRKWQEA